MRATKTKTKSKTESPKKPKKPKKDLCPCTDCDGHEGCCAQPPDDDRESFDGYCEECYAHCLDSDGKLAMAEDEFTASLEAEFE